jgi:hypothetical protein
MMMIFKFNYCNLLALLSCLMLFLMVNSITFMTMLRYFEFHFDFLIFIF